MCGNSAGVRPLPLFESQSASSPAWKAALYFACTVCTETRTDVGAECQEAFSPEETSSMRFKISCLHMWYGQKTHRFGDFTRCGFGAAFAHRGVPDVVILFYTLRRHPRK